jgi:selenide,water dikinase
LQGGADKVAESGAVVIGGHTVTDKELKYGLAVTGFIDPADIKKNNNVKAGDKLLLTKPIGTGILTTALKNDHFTEPDIADAIRSMLLLNREPAMLLQKYKANAVTDVTGFGLIGHLHEMITGTGLGAFISVEDIPVFEKSLPLAEIANHIPGGTLANINYVQSAVIMGKIPEWYLNILADPQTSGGLLISMPKSEVTAFKDELEKYPYQISEIGEIQSGDENITLV